MTKTKRLIKSYMVLNGLNQEEMASILGIRRQTFNLKINGHNPFKEEEKQRISELFNIPVKEIFFNEKVDKTST